MNRLFGTDGVRGVANAQLTPELAFRIGRAGAAVLARSSDARQPIVIGRDTRLSGPMLEAATIAGVTSVGRHAIALGVLPTPAVACITRREHAAAGVVISASHNPIEDNGIKFFGGDGFKLSDELEDEIEALLDSDSLPRPTGIAVGTSRYGANLGKHYYRQLYESGVRLDGLDVVVDGAYGAAYAIAPYALRKLGATVTELHCEDDGSRINVACGATDLRPLQAAVRARIEAGARNTVGVAFDGDADRALFVDERAHAVNGDRVLFAIARDLQARGELHGNAVVATVMSNMGFERALAHHAIATIRTAVGDRYVLARMRADGYVLGGEQSGHVIDFRHNTTGDGLMTAVTLLGILAAQQTTLRDLVAEVADVPQILLNVRTTRRDVLSAPAVRAATERAQAALDRAGGRLLIRPSGTEPLVRVMAEGDDRSLIERLTAEIAAEIEKEIERPA